MSEWTIFGERLSHIMREYDVSIRELSRRTGITLTTLHRYATCKRVPKATEILKCANALGITCDYLLGLSDDPHLTGKGEQIKDNNLPTVQPVAPTESHTSKWHDLIKDPTDLPEMHDAGILKSLGIKMISDQCFATILCDDGTRIVDVSAHLRDGKWHTDTGRWINVSGHKSEVVAWMPVIEPYRPEERKDGEANAEYRD